MRDNVVQLINIWADWHISHMFDTTSKTVKFIKLWPNTSRQLYIEVQDHIIHFDNQATGTNPLVPVAR